MTDVLAVIPARYGSTRFPGKPLAAICGKPLIQHVWEAAIRCRVLSRVVIATDDERICEVAHAFGAECVMTGECASGTDRVAEVARRSAESLVLNIQGDEPLLQPEWLEALVEPLRSNPSIPMSTLRTSIRNPYELDDPNVVKVVCRPDSTALYFSRARIPHQHKGSCETYKHVGLYGYRREFLLHLAALPPSPLELIESLEQLRALETGATIAVPIHEIDGIAVDRPEDVARVEAVMTAGANPHSRKEGSPW